MRHLANRLVAYTFRATSILTEITGAYYSGIPQFSSSNNDIYGLGTIDTVHLKFNSPLQMVQSKDVSLHVEVEWHK